MQISDNEEERQRMILEDVLFHSVGHHALLYGTEHEILWEGLLPIEFKATKDCTVWFAIIFDKDNHALYYSWDLKKTLNPGDTFTFGPYKPKDNDVCAVMHYSQIRYRSDD